MIELKNVSFSYPAQKGGGLSNVNFTVQDGECILLCGRSGCGKTTITRLVNGLIPKFYPGELKGRVTVNDKDLSALPMYEISKHVGFCVPESPYTIF